MASPEIQVGTFGPRTRAAARHRGLSFAFAAISVRLLLRLYFFGPPILAILGTAVFLVTSSLGWLWGITPALTAIFEVLPCRQRLLQIEAIMPGMLLSWAVGGAMIGWFGWLGRHRFSARAVRREELRLARLLRHCGLVLTVCLFLFALAARWSSPLHPDSPGDCTSYSALLGHVPWSDAIDYYWGAHEATHTGQINAWSERRPVNASLFSLRLAICRFDLDVASLIQVLLLAVAVYFAAWSMGEHMGIWSGVGCLALMFGYARFYLATTLSESLGLTFGALALGLLVQALRRQDWRLCTAGLLAMALAMSARAGALFLLPCLLVWAGWCFRDSWRQCLKVFAAGGLAIALGMGSSLLLDRAYGVGKSVAGANLAHTLCGLSCGTTWSDAADLYADELKNLPDERDQARFLYAKAWQRIQADPSVFFRSLEKGEMSFFRQIPSFFMETIAMRSVSPSRLTRMFDAILLLVLSCGALAWLWRRRLKGEIWLAVATACGILLSIPFIFMDGGWRVLAASWPLMIAPLAAGLSVPGRRAPWLTRTSIWHCRAAVGSLMALAVCIAVGPAVASRISTRPDIAQSSATPDPSRLVIRCWPGFASVAVVEEGQPRIQGVPTITRQQFIERVLLGNIEDRDSLLVPNVPPAPFLILSSYDFLARRPLHLIAPLALKDETSPFLELHVRPWRKSAYFSEVIDFRPYVGHPK